VVLVLSESESYYVLVLSTEPECHRDVVRCRGRGVLFLDSESSFITHPTGRRPGRLWTGGRRKARAAFFSVSPTESESESS
jgi:hypothetical protein